MTTTLAGRLRFLFENVYPRGRGPFTQTEVVDTIRQGGGTMTTGHLSQLLSGKRTNPGMAVLADISKFFRVPADYFTDDEIAEQIQRDILAIVRVRDSDATHVASRTYDPYRRLRQWTGSDDESVDE